MEEDDMVMRVGSSLMIERDEPIRREGLQARGIYKEVPRPSRRLALATRQKIPYTTSIYSSYSLFKTYLTYSPYSSLVIK
jgi:hypothetical protein